MNINQVLKFDAIKLFSIGFSVILLVGSSLAQTNYQLTEMLPATGYTQSEVTAVNDRNEMTGASYPPVIDWNGVATKWSNGRAVNLKRAARGTYSLATAINDRGTVVGDGDDGNLRPNAMLFGTTGPTILTKGLNNSYAVFVSNSGTIIGNSIRGFDSVWLPTIWREEPNKPRRYRMRTLTLMTDPGDGSADNFVYGANHEGEAVGIVSNSLLGQKGALWNSDQTLQILPDLENDWGGNAYGINDWGVIVGASLGGTMKPVMWLANEDRTPVALPLLPGETVGYAVGINNLGQVIGYHDSAYHPAVWIDGKLIDLQSSLVGVKGWVLERVSDINNNGVIVGTGRKNGIQRGFMLTPVSPQ